MELSGYFLSLEGLVKFFSAWRTEKKVRLWFARGDQTRQADTMFFYGKAELLWDNVTKTTKWGEGFQTM